MASNMASVFAGDSTEEITLEIEPLTHLKDSKLEREGTYEIDGENLYISFPEGKGQSAGAISISSKAVENAEVAIDGNTLATNGFQQRAVKLSRKRPQTSSIKNTLIGLSRWGLKT